MILYISCGIIYLLKIKSTLKQNYDLFFLRFSNNLGTYIIHIFILIIINDKHIFNKIKQFDINIFLIFVIFLRFN